ncbi:MAG TPA: copper oxidase [Solirubrobacterales bacterium]|nr:copper oxidase [Solirubrobacterales bacterium]
MADKQEEKLNVLPWLASGALIVAVAALAFAVVARGRSGDQGSGTEPGSTMSAMSGEDMAHMAPLPMKGIGAAASSTGGTELHGVERDGALEFKLDARPVRWPILAGQELDAYAYDGIVPGPTIRVKNAQRVRIRFTNDLPVDTTVHWHGIGVPNSMDGVPGVTQKAIPPGGEYTYEFTARPAGEPNGGGTFLYHSHVDEDRQMAAGLYGAFIIEPPGPQPEYQTESTLVLSEWTADAASGRTRGVMDMEGMLPNFFTINGKSYPATETIHVKAGAPVLLRLINAGQLTHPMHLHGTAFRVVAEDGHPVPDSGLRDTISLASGERADVVFRLPPGRWILHCHIGHHMTNDGESPGGLMEVIEAS